MGKMMLMMSGKEEGGSGGGAVGEGVMVMVMSAVGKVEMVSVQWCGGGGDKRVAPSELVR